MKNVALITGASSGIGLEIARHHAALEQDLILVARSTTKLIEIKKELEQKHGIKVYNIPKDLSIPDAAIEVFEEINENGLQVDYLINNAGFGDFGFFHEADWDKQEMMINLNMLTLTHLTHLFLPQMVARKSGKILNVASTAAFQPGPLMAVYYATKHYVLAFSEAIANELAETGVTVTTLCPGPTESGFQSAASIEDSKLVKGKKLPTSKEVAIYGYKSMMRGRRVAIPGSMNKIMATSIRFTPRNLVTTIVRKMQEKG